MQSQTKPRKSLVTLVVLACGLVSGGCWVQTLPPLPPVPVCLPLPERGPEGMTSLFIAKSDSPFLVCARLYNGLATPLIMERPTERDAPLRELRPLNRWARVQRWWLCQPATARAEPGVALLSPPDAAQAALPPMEACRAGAPWPCVVAPGEAFDMQLRPCAGWAIPGTYEVLVHYGMLDTPPREPARALRSAPFSLP